MGRYDDPYDEPLDEEEWADRVERFRDPVGTSALHPGERTERCPSCGEPNRLTKRDIASGYQCDACADRDEMGF